MYPALKLLIGGRALDAGERPGEAVINPATEEVLGELPHATAADLDAALAAAERGFADWSARSAFDRAKVLRKAGELIRAKAKDHAGDLTAEQGKPFKQAMGEVLTCPNVLDWYADEGRRTYGRIVPSRDPRVQHQVVKEPVGPAVAFTPWNFPMFMAAHKVGAALAAGCSLILKPAEETPASAMHLVEALHEAGLPPDVLSLVFGVPAEVSERLIASPVVRKVSFTGSVAVGRHLLKLCAEDLKRTTMELGGHAPVLVFDDVDIAGVAREAAAAKFANAGQVCISPTRFYVAERSHDAFVAEFTRAAAALKLGDGSDPATQMGPLANPRRLAAMEGLVADAVGRGATLQTGGERIGNRGYFFAPTVLSDVPADARVMQEEPFGPIAAISSFSDPEDAVRKANGTPYGLAGYAFTRSTETSARMAAQLKVGMLGINTFDVSTVETPFGGVKHSGHGQEGGAEGLDAFLDVKHVVLA